MPKSNLWNFVVICQILINCRNFAFHCIICLVPKLPLLAVIRITACLEFKAAYSSCQINMKYRRFSLLLSPKTLLSYMKLDYRSVNGFFGLPAFAEVKKGEGWHWQWNYFRKTNGRLACSKKSDSNKRLQIMRWFHITAWSTLYLLNW